MESAIIQGRIDELGRVLLPIIVVAADGSELELEASINLGFGGAMAIQESIARGLGWQRLGSRRVIVGLQTVVMDHYLGTISLGGGEPNQYVVLSGTREYATIGQKMLSGCSLKIDFRNSLVMLE